MDRFAARDERVHAPLGRGWHQGRLTLNHRQDLMARRDFGEVDVVLQADFLDFGLLVGRQNAVDKVGHVVGIEPGVRAVCRRRRQSPAPNDFLDARDQFQVEPKPLPDLLCLGGISVSSR